MIRTVCAGCRPAIVVSPKEYLERLCYDPNFTPVERYMDGAATVIMGEMGRIPDHERGGPTLPPSRPQGWPSEWPRVFVEEIGR